MHQRGRPTGTDGSDFSYRMVVDNRYTKVAQGNITVSTMMMKDDTPMNQFGIFSVILGFVSLIIGELGRKRSRISFLKLFLVGSTISTVLSYVFILRHLRLLEALKDLSNLVNSKVELFGIVTILLDSLVQVKTTTTTILLIGNMKPPKKSS